jgi:hypothetical protein
MAKKSYPQGHWMGIGMAIGMVFGTFVFFIADLLTGEFGSMFFLGPGAGVAIGVSIGTALEERYKRSGRIRKLTAKEEKRQRKLVTLGVVILVIGALAGLLAFMALV